MRLHHSWSLGSGPNLFPVTTSGYHTTINHIIPWSLFFCTSWSLVLLSLLGVLESRFLCARQVICLFSPLRLTTGEASFLSPRVIRGGVLFIRGGVELGFRRGIFGVLRRRGIFVISEGYFYFWSGWGIFGISEEEGYFWSPGRIGILEGWNWGVSLTVKRFWFNPSIICFVFGFFFVSSPLTSRFLWFPPDLIRVPFFWVWLIASRVVVNVIAWD